MNKKTAISILLTLLMIASAFSAMSVNANELTASDTEENLSVEKTVWDGCSWTDSINAEFEDTVRFKIVIDYDQVLPAGYKATNLVVMDELPTCLEYANDAVITYGEDTYYGESFVDGKNIWWNLTEDYGIELYLNPESGPDVVSIEFNATVVDCGENVNNVYVTGKETCSNEPLYGHDYATVFVECEEPCEPGIEVIKKVWNGTAWAEYIGDLTLGDIVKFKIEIIYHACDDYVIKNMIVTDYLPCCLEYVNGSSVVTTTGNGAAQPADITVSSDKKEIIWDWTYNNEVTLNGGDSLIIEFDAVVTNYCEEIDENWVYVEAWGCSGPTFYGQDNASVDCTPQETTFEKLVWDEKSEEWVDEIQTTQGSILRFRLKLDYYGAEDLEEVQFYDELPCILEYANNLYSNIEDIEKYVEVSNDSKHIWWNLTGITVKDGDTIVIEFDAIVTGISVSGCPLCECEKEFYNYANVRGKIGCTQDPNFFMEDEVLIHSDGNCPPSAPGVTGDTIADLGEEIQIKVKTTDPDGDQVYYMIDWGDESEGIWVGPSNSSQEITLKHTYTQADVYEVYAKAKDENGVQSDWSYYPHKITIIENPIDLRITLPMFSRGMISASIENYGEDDLADIDWEITATGGMLGKVNVSANGTVDIESDDLEKINSGAGSIGAGFGKITGKIKASIGEYEVEKEFSGFLIGKFILFQPTFEPL
jgi:fimbrial isopeptide formation D2 family protein